MLFDSAIKHNLETQKEKQNLLFFPLLFLPFWGSKMSDFTILFYLLVFLNIHLE